MFSPYRCPKCGSAAFELSELRGSSGGITAYLDLDTAIFTAVTCSGCRFTEFYAMPLGEAEAMRRTAKAPASETRLPPRSGPEFELD